jgi:hypothetical protein
MTVTELLNHSRLCTLNEVRLRLERLRETRPDEYEIIENFILSCKSKTPPKPN